jgi:hypothetical protein
MIRNEHDNVVLISTGYAEENIQLQDGEEILPGGYFMELGIDDDVFVVPVNQETYNAVHNSVVTTTNLNTTNG